ncbi:MAG: tRNA (N6-threonylcarbamoyladenosine(37)-N6)-methyltransferase TrmO [Rhizobiales bacterium]|nr:tRNA (N6-threonylcarbamoyladenosine(37)-N6)-methyltransferase TrmO [Hyphomicrobiales bacterium]
MPGQPDAAVYFIGRIRTPWKSRKDCPKNARESEAVCTVELDARWREGLTDVETCSHLVLLYWMDKAPRNLSLRTFALRSPARPNPIAMSVVRLVGIEGGTLSVVGLDCLDGTPLIDIKPYFASTDSLSSWCDFAEVNVINQSHQQSSEVVVGAGASWGVAYPYCKRYPPGIYYANWAQKIAVAFWRPSVSALWCGVVWGGMAMWRQFICTCLGAFGAVGTARRISTNCMLAATVMIVVASFGQTAFADWIDTKTGQRVADWPSIGGRVIRGMDRNHAYDPETGRNFARNACGDWIDTKTGQRVADWPSIGGRVIRGMDRNHAYDPETGRNFAREACPPRAATTAPTAPQVGMVIEPKISAGLGGSSGTSTYDSTGGQAPFSGDWSHTTGQLCGGATFYPGFAVGPARVGLDVNVCSGSSNTLFQINRHGPGGDVDLHASTNVIIDVLFKGEVPLDPLAVYDPQTQRWFVSAGIGPTFRQLDLTLTSNQSFFVGGVPSISETTWQTGLGVSAGLSTFVCPDCIAGNPLKVGVEGRARFFPSQSISLRSPAFGFTETGSTGRTIDYSALITFGVPFALP